MNVGSMKSIDDIIRHYTKEDKPMETVKPDELEGIVDISAEEFICEECSKPLSKDDDYHVQYGTCNSYCYGKMVGVYF